MTSPVPVQDRNDVDRELEEPRRQLPEGLILTLAAVFGAVMVLGALLAARPLLTTTVDGEETEEADVGGDEAAAADPEPSPSPGGPPTTGVLPPGLGDGQRDGQGDGDDLGDLMPGLPPSGGTPGADADSDVEILPCPAGTDPVICEAAAFVQQTRGRPFRTFPVVELLPDAEFDRELLDDFDEYRDELDVDDVTLSAIGLIDPEVSLSMVYRDLLEVGVVGFYDPETGQLVVRGAEFDLYGRLVLVHELTHAFDDQWFDLSRDDFADDDAEYGYSAVVEGNASRVDQAWRSRLSASDQAELTEQEFGALSAEDLQRYLALPPAIQSLQGSPYLDGAAYVEHLLQLGGEAAVDAALVDPPTSSEEVLHPTVNRSVEPEIVVPVPPAGGPIVDQGRLGELVIRLWLGQVAAEGWGGDRYVSWTADGRDCIAVDLIGDDDDETTQLEAGANAWAGLGSESRAVERVSVDGLDLVRVTACSLS